MNGLRQTDISLRLPTTQVVVATRTCFCKFDWSQTHTILVVFLTPIDRNQPISTPLTRVECFRSIFSADAPLFDFPSALNWYNRPTNCFRTKITPFEKSGPESTGCNPNLPVLMGKKKTDPLACLETNGASFIVGNRCAQHRKAVPTKGHASFREYKAHIFRICSHVFASLNRSEKISWKSEISTIKSTCLSPNHLHPIPQLGLEAFPNGWPFKSQPAPCGC